MMARTVAAETTVAWVLLGLATTGSAEDRPVMKQAEPKAAEPPAVAAPPVPAPADIRIPLPSTDARRTSLARVKEIFADDFAAAVPPAKKSDLAKRLADQAAQTQQPADRWALLSEALRLATDGGDAATALALMERIPAEFAVERNASRLEAITRLAPKAASPAQDEVASTCLDIARDADKAGHEDVATKAIALADGIARKIKNPALVADVGRLQQKIKERQKLAKELQPLLENIAAIPADPEANLEAGRALCLKGDRWSEGLPLLAKGSDAALARLANAEQANPTAAADLVRLADAWWDWADGQKSPWKVPAQVRAGTFYGRVVNDLQGLEKARVEKRIATVAAAGGGTGQTIFLADLQEVEVRDVLDEKCFSKDAMLYGPPFAVNGKMHTKAIMALPKASATSVVTYRLPIGTTTIRGRVGIFTPNHAKRDDQHASPLKFELVGDGRVMWSSPALAKRDDTAPFDNVIRGTSKLELRTTSTGHANNAWGAWLDPLIVK